MIAVGECPESWPQSVEECHMLLDVQHRLIEADAALIRAYEIERLEKSL